MDRKTVHQALLAAKEQLLHKQRLERQLAEAEESLQSQKDSVLFLEKKWRSETDDVKRLMGMSVIALVTSVLGTKEWRLEKERQEQAAAFLKLEAGREVAAKLESDCDELAYEIKGLEGSEKAYASALADKERLIRDEGVPGRKLAELAEAEGNTNAKARETREALAAGNKAARGLARVVESMLKASNWGTWDMMGGGWIATSLKHSNLDDAKAAAIAAQSDLHHFKRELADVGRDLAATIEIGGFSRFADYFFDGLIVDWSVQSRISNALTQAQEASSRVRTLIMRLEQDLEQCQEEQSSLRAKRQELIEQA